MGWLHGFGVMDSSLETKQDGATEIALSQLTIQQIAEKCVFEATYVN
jgi:hypothetical protein